MEPQVIESWQCTACLTTGRVVHPIGDGAIRILNQVLREHNAQSPACKEGMKKIEITKVR